jgi:hypothetical protein
MVFPATFVGVVFGWLYDRGPGQFVRVLTFRNGHVDTIALAGYGEP